MTAKIHDLYFNDGEGLSYADLNRVQRQLYTTLFDLFAEHMMMSKEGQAGVEMGLSTASRIYAPGGLGGTPLPGGGNRTSTVRPGLLLLPDDVNTAVAGDADQRIWPVYIQASDVAITHDVGGAQDRWDLVSVDLAALAAADLESRHIEDATTRAITSQNVYKRYRQALSVTTTKGAEAATPTIPATPANHRRLYAVKVVAGMGASAFTSAHFRSYVIPTPTRLHRCYHHEYWPLGTDWAKHATSMQYRASTAGDLYVPIPSAGLAHSGRLLRVEVSTTTSGATWPAVELGSLSEASTGAPSFTSNRVLNDGTTTGSTNEDLMDDDEPYWLNGYAHPYGLTNGGRPVLKITSDGLATNYLYYVRFLLAGT
jgi:hypothetical protein